MEGEAAAPEAIPPSVESGDEGAIATALREAREKKIAAVKKAAQPEQNSKPEAKTEPKGQPEQKAEDAEPKAPTAISEVEEPKAEEPASKEPEAADADKPAEAKPEEPKEPPRFKVAFDGKEEEVTVDELRSGYMRQRDYTLKTQELSKERETFSSETTQKRQVIDTTLNELGVIAQQMVQRLVDQDQRTDWNQLKQTDPESYAVRVAERTESRELLRHALAKANQIREQQQQEQTKKQQAEFEARRKTEESKLALVIPEWSDPVKARAEKTELAKHLLERGFTEDEVESLADHRIVVLAREAMLHRRTQEARRKAEGDKRVEAKAPASAAVSKPNAGQSQTFERAQSKFAKTGSIEDAAKLMAARRKATRR